MDIFIRTHVLNVQADPPSEGVPQWFESMVKKAGPSAAAVLKYAPSIMVFAAALGWVNHDLWMSAVYTMEEGTDDCTTWRHHRDRIRSLVANYVQTDLDGGGNVKVPAPATAYEKLLAFASQVPVAWDFALGHAGAADGKARVMSCDTFLNVGQDTHGDSIDMIYFQYMLSRCPADLQATFRLVSVPKAEFDAVSPLFDIVRRLHIVGGTVQTGSEHRHAPDPSSHDPAQRSYMNPESLQRVVLECIQTYKESIVGADDRRAHVACNGSPLRQCLLPELPQGMISPSASQSLLKIDRVKPDIKQSDFISKHKLGTVFTCTVRIPLCVHGSILVACKRYDLRLGGHANGMSVNILRDMLVNEMRLLSTPGRYNPWLAYPVGRFTYAHYVAILSEYIPGISLSAYISKRKQGENHHYTLDNGTGHIIPDIAMIAYQLILAVYTTHTMTRIVHRDMKPGNVIVEPSGYIKIIDLDFIGTIQPGVTNDIFDSTATMTVGAGTRPYLSPDLITQKSIHNEHVTVDYFSVGMILAYMTMHDDPDTFENIDKDKFREKYIKIRKSESWTLETFLSEALVQKVRATPWLASLVEKLMLTRKMTHQTLHELLFENDMLKTIRIEDVIKRTYRASKEMTETLKPPDLSGNKFPVKDTKLVSTQQQTEFATRVLEMLRIPNDTLETEPGFT